MRCGFKSDEGVKSRGWLNAPLDISLFLCSINAKCQGYKDVNFDHGCNLGFCHEKKI